MGGDLLLPRNEKKPFSLIFLNVGISEAVVPRHFKSRYVILSICMEGVVSQNVDICPSFCFINCRK